MAVSLLVGLTNGPVAAQTADPHESGQGPHDEACGTTTPRQFDLPARADDGTFDPLVTGFGLEIDGNIIPYRLMSLFVRPRQTIEIETVLGSPSSDFQVCAQGGTLEKIADRKWSWTSPGPGTETLIHTSDLLTGDAIVLRVFVLHPYDGEDQVEGYRIGEYERLPLYDNPMYEMPNGMLRVTEGMEDVWISPHFQLRQFLCKQEVDGRDGPKFMLVSTRLLLKLELLLERVNERGVKALTFAVLSGYRTPHYNVSIGNRTKYSRHAYGDAADIYVDEDGNGRMDDLNGDGRSNYSDAVWLSRIIEENLDSSWYAPFVGGLGIYGPKPHRGAFIHVDTRGFKARWNQP